MKVSAQRRPASPLEDIVPRPPAKPDLPLPGDLSPDQAITKLMRLHHLGLREAQAVCGILRDLHNDEIAREFGMALGTFRTHLLRATIKLGATSRTHLVMLAATTLLGSE